MDRHNPLNPRHGGALRELLGSPAETASLREQSVGMVSWSLSPTQESELELLINGAFSPLSGFMRRADYDSVLSTMRLFDGSLWPMPVTLNVTERFADRIAQGECIALRDAEGCLLAVLQIADIWRPDKREEAQQIYGTVDPRHPGVERLLNDGNDVYLGGRALPLEPPAPHDSRRLRHSPSTLRQLFIQRGWDRIAAFQICSPLQRAQLELALQASRSAQASLLLHPLETRARPDDGNYALRMRAYQHLARTIPLTDALHSTLPLTLRRAGPREGIWHAIIRKNYGCSHFLIERDHADAGTDAAGRCFYPPYAALEAAMQHEDEIGIEILSLPTSKQVGIRRCGRSRVDARPREREGARDGNLRVAVEPFDDSTFEQSVRDFGDGVASRWGCTVFFTGLSGAGKSTIAKALLSRLEELGRNVTLLDGDRVRNHLSSELGFSREHRDLNVLRIGYVASEITKHGGIAICAPIAPYATTRRKVRQMVAEYGGFVEVYVATPLEVCEARDRKGLYAKARAGLIEQFTGISDPYEPPEDAEVTIETSDCTPDEAADRILACLHRQGDSVDSQAATACMSRAPTAHSRFAG